MEKAGVSCWFAKKDISPGSDYAIEIPKAISACSYFVLFLTDESQNSPYVMLELDQAFKQKKNIIPVLLDKIVQNQKTNFFLNAKQSVDATQDLTAAINEVIQKVKSKEHIDPDQTEYITCPHCGRSVLRFRNGKNHYLDTEKKMSDHTFDFFGYAFLLPAGFFVYSLIYFSRLPGDTLVHPITDYGINIFMLLAMLSVTLAGICIRRFSKEWHAIRRSKLQVWKFVCLGCKRKFSFYAPLSEEPENRVKELFYEKAKHETSKHK